MSAAYESMWKDLGLDLAAHDVLLQVLGNVYRDIFLSQKDRPAGMDYFNFVMGEVHGLRIKELLEGKKRRQEGHRLLLRVCAGGDRPSSRRHPRRALHWR